MTAWTAHLQQINRPGGGICLAHLHPGTVATSWQQALQNTLNLDMARYRRIHSERGHVHLIATQAGAGQLDRARNDACRVFLDADSHEEADYLLFIDSDMGWEPDAPHRLAETMDAHDLDICGGLCFGQKVVGMDPRNYTPVVEWFPTIYSWSTQGKAAFDTRYDYPADTVVEVGATGAAFLMISRRCLEAIREVEGDNWFTPARVEGADRPFGEDMSFCLRSREHGFKVHVHTGIRTSHKKETWFTEADYRELRAPTASAVTVVIPVKDNLTMTRSLVGQLVGQGGVTDILIFDNGSEDPEMVEWLADQTVASVFDAEGASISEMWNAGIDEAIARHHGLAEIVFLNNDIALGPACVRRLVAGLRSSPGAMAVCPDYDSRAGNGVSPLRGICANRYDGTGGLAGFAFALRAEWIASGFRFDEDMAWYFSDNDLCLQIEKAGGWYGMVHDAKVAHLDGGSATERPGWWDERIAKDREAFEKKWPTVTLTAA